MHPCLVTVKLSLLTNISVMAYSDGSKTVVHENVGNTVHDSFSSKFVGEKIKGVLIYRAH